MIIPAGTVSGQRTIAGTRIDPSAGGLEKSPRHGPLEPPNPNAGTWQAYKALRQAFGGSLLLALEILVAADLIRTVAVSPTLDNVLVLGLIVLIRTFLSFSLEIEIKGMVPWRRALASGLGTIKQATQTALQSDRD